MNRMIATQLVLFVGIASLCAGVPPKKSNSIESNILNELVGAQKTGEAINKGFNGLYKPVADAAGTAGKNIDAIKEKYDALTGHDKAVEPQPEPPGMPEVPLNCQQSAKCSSCFTEAYEALRQARISFERLRAVWATAKTVHDRGLALGDSMGSVHPVAGLQWQAERVRLESEWKKVQKSYDAKHAELSLKLQAALKKIGECEKQHYSVDDWYNRYGFIYYTFMTDRYRRDR
jgi:hypothetical protein